MNAAMSSARSLTSDPLKARPIGVRAVATMTGSGMAGSSWLGRFGLRLAALRPAPSCARESAGRLRGYANCRPTFSVEPAALLAVAGAVADVVAGTPGDER